MNREVLAKTLDVLANEIARQAAARRQGVGGGDGGTTFPLTGDQAVTAIIMAVREVAERVSQP